MKYTYLLTGKVNNAPIQDVFMSREEARSAKRMYESRDGEKYKIERYKKDAVVR